MLCILSTSGLTSEFWGLAGTQETFKNLSEIVSVSDNIIIVSLTRVIIFILFFPFTYK